MTVRDRCGQRNELPPVMYFFFRKVIDCFMSFLKRKYDLERGKKMNVEKKKKFVRYGEGSELYSMSLRKFQEIAKEAGAIYKIGKIVLVNCEILDEYLETFKL